MSLELAINDVVTTLNSLATVVEDDQEPGSVDYHLAVSIGDQETFYHFGAKRIRQEISLMLTVNGTIANSEIATKCRSISDALETDRRRGGNAQTTVIGPWEKQEDEGREGRIFETIIEVHIYE